MYKVVVAFIDVTDDRAYNVGDAFPRDGAVVSAERIHKLSSNENHLRKPVIEEVYEEQPQPVKKKSSRKRVKADA